MHFLREKSQLLSSEGLRNPSKNSTEPEYRKDKLKETNSVWEAYKLQKKSAAIRLWKCSMPVLPVK